jgi:hypothetical protein
VRRSLVQSDDSSLKVVMPIRSNLAFKTRFPICSVCNEPVELDTAKVDEVGNAIHEECFVANISIRKATTLSLKEREKMPKVGIIHFPKQSSNS